MGPRGWSNVHVSPHRNINLMNSDGRTMYGRAKQDSGLWGSFVSVLSSLLSDNGDVIPSRAADVVSRAVFHDTISDTSQLGRPLGRCSLTPPRRGFVAQISLLIYVFGSRLWEDEPWYLLYLCNCIYMIRDL